MSVALLYSRALDGMAAQRVLVETHLSSGLPSFVIVGLPETEIKEARDRVRAAILNSGFEFPNQHITVNLAPADLPKKSSRFDLAIALGILAASEQLPLRDLLRYEFVGELSLAGELRAIQGALPIALATLQTPESSDTPCLGLILPTANAAEACLARQVALYPAQHLLEVCAHFIDPNKALQRYQAAPADLVSNELPTQLGDWQDIIGQAQAKRALTIAACGGHSVLMAGPPGSGKTMLAQRFATLLPLLPEDEALTVASIHSLHQQFQLQRWRQRPFRAPHHTASAVAMVGGGAVPRPGEISLAHGGVLFLDELPEFERKVLEVLREPLESGTITISRAARQAQFPARFQLIAAMNPCPCGYLGHRNNRCRCSLDQIARYQSKISGPLLDRIDIQIEVPAVPASDLQLAAASQKNDSSATVREIVARCQTLQLTRQGKLNHLLTGTELLDYAQLSPTSAQFLHQVIERLGWSTRAYHRILRLARTLCDYQLALMNQTRSEQTLSHAAVAEAIQYRRVLRTS